MRWKDPKSSVWKLHQDIHDIHIIKYQGIHDHRNCLTEHKQIYLTRLHQLQ